MMCSFPLEQLFRMDSFPKEILREFLSCAAHTDALGMGPCEGACYVFYVLVRQCRFLSLYLDLSCLKTHICKVVEVVPPFLESWTNFPVSSLTV